MSSNEVVIVLEDWFSFWPLHAYMYLTYDLWPDDVCVEKLQKRIKMTVDSAKQWNTF